MRQVRTYRDAFDAIEEYVDSAKSRIAGALTIARKIEADDTADRDDISTIIYNLEAAIEDLKE